MLHPPGISAFARGHVLTNLGADALEGGYDLGTDALDTGLDEYEDE